MRTGNFPISRLGSDNETNKNTVKTEKRGNYTYIDSRNYHHHRRNNSYKQQNWVDQLDDIESRNFDSYNNNKTFKQTAGGGQIKLAQGDQEISDLMQLDQIIQRATIAKQQRLLQLNTTGNQDEKSFVVDQSAASMFVEDPVTQNEMMQTPYPTQEFDILHTNANNKYHPQIKIRQVIPKKIGRYTVTSPEEEGFNLNESDPTPLEQIMGYDQNEFQQVRQKYHTEKQSLRSSLVNLNEEYYKTKNTFSPDKSREGKTVERFPNRQNWVSSSPSKLNEVNSLPFIADQSIIKQFMSFDQQFTQDEMQVIRQMITKYNKQEQIPSQIDEKQQSSIPLNLEETQKSTDQKKRKTKKQKRVKMNRNILETSKLDFDSFQVLGATNQNIQLNTTEYQRSSLQMVTEVTPRISQQLEQRAEAQYKINEYQESLFIDGSQKTYQMTPIDEQKSDEVHVLIIDDKSQKTKQIGTQREIQNQFVQKFERIHDSDDRKIDNIKTSQNTEVQTPQNETIDHLIKEKHQDECEGNVLLESRKYEPEKAQTLDQESSQPEKVQILDQESQKPEEDQNLDQESSKPEEDQMKEIVAQQVQQKKKNVYKPSNPVLLKEKYKFYKDITNSHGLSVLEMFMFGNRSPAGYKKVRLFSKINHQVFWLFEKEQIKKPLFTNKNKPVEKQQQYMMLQIPRFIKDHDHLMKMVSNLKSCLYKQLNRIQGISNLIFQMAEIIDDPNQIDIWVVYQPLKDIDMFYSMHTLLWEKSFTPNHQPTYKYQHSKFFQSLSEKDGKKNIALIISRVCKLINMMTEGGILYANLRVENIMLKMKPNLKDIEDIRFLNFGNIVKFDGIDNICIPSRVEHMPPELLRHLIFSERFVEEVKLNNTDEFKDDHQDSIDVKLLQATTTMDIYSLGIVLLQILTGCPPQLELPIKVKVKTVTGDVFVTTPAFGTCPNGVISKKQVGMTIQMQERYGKHTKTILSKLDDYYNLLGDNEFCEMFMPMISNDHEKRPTVSEILSSDFIKKWTDKKYFL